jgi:hypothetical protein
MMVALILAAASMGAVCCLGMTVPLMDAPPDYPLDRALRVEATAVRYGRVGGAFTAAGVVLKALTDWFTNRASTPLPAPPVDPLATYREGAPPECPRHPFAR